MGHLTLGVVVPIYGYTHLLEEIQARIEGALSPIMEDFAVIYVEDGGSEESWARVRQFTQQCARARGIRLARNYGQQSAIAAGLQHCQGHWAAVMDGDLQDPPELLPGMWREAQCGGYDLVMTARRVSGQAALRDWLGKLYHSLLQGRWNPPRYACFSLLGPRVLEQYLKDPRRGEFFITVLLDLSARRTLLSFDRQAAHGRSTYTLPRLFKLAFRKLAGQFLWWSGRRSESPRIEISERAKL